VEEAPAPFLTSEQVGLLYSASKAILRRAGYQGAGTCEFLVGQDGSISFLEVNTRLQVEHPVSEEVTGLDLVREMFRIAEGHPLGYDDPPARGHSIEFRINAEDPARNFMPAPGTIRSWQLPAGPGVRVDAGYEPGMTVPQAFDSLIAKLIVTGATRQQALERARRALAEFEVQGMPTVLPFHRAVVSDPAFAAEPMSVYTRWIETDFAAELVPQDTDPADEPAARERMIVEVAGKRVEVVMPAALNAPVAAGAGPAAGPRRGGPRRRHAAPVGSGADLASPMQGTIVKIVAADGQSVSAGDPIVILEAMKMEQPVTAHKDGTVAGLSVQVGETVTAHSVICRIEDDPSGESEDPSGESSGEFEDPSGE
jgi:acetyl-CoA/propionyl-CoA carboxylase biotin carboxyl carrier protein